jgi:hypothetical protein
MNRLLFVMVMVVSLTACIGGGSQGYVANDPPEDTEQRYQCHAFPYILDRDRWETEYVCAEDEYGAYWDCMIGWEMQDRDDPRRELCDCVEVSGKCLSRDW